jgi:uncharacterized damage-inducible protein DinB
VAKFPNRSSAHIRPLLRSAGDIARNKQTWNLLIHGQIQHQLYHAGQIAMLRRGMGKEIKQ